MHVVLNVPRTTQNNNLKNSYTVKKKDMDTKVTKNTLNKHNSNRISIENYLDYLCNNIMNSYPTLSLIDFS